VYSPGASAVIGRTCVGELAVLSRVDQTQTEQMKAEMHLKSQEQRELDS
jgi:hypothetical protein